ncbi:MAG: 16S rRNA (guanine(527)-N(7))-methyltransferase RsmG [Dehalococcoidia bacterium]
MTDEHPSPAVPPPPSEDDRARLVPLLQEVVRLGITLDDTEVAAFRRYLDLLSEWNERAGLTSVTDPAEVQRRHFAESLAVLVAIREAGLLPADGRVRIADLGPGGGFPGLPMRIVEPAFHLVLVESNQKRADFLLFATRELGLADVEVVAARAEDAGRDPALRGLFDLVVARAVASLNVLVEYALPLLREGGVLVAPKGSRARDELVEAAPAIEALGGVALDPVPLSLPADVAPQTVILVRREGTLDDRFPRRAGMPAKRPLA